MINQLTRPVWKEVNLKNIQFNFRQIKEQVGEDILICPVVKANAYGHGLIPVTEALVNAGADRVAVALPEEGIELREAGFDLPILVLGEVLNEQISLLIEYDLTPTISKRETVETLNNLAKQKKIKKKVHVKIDTGMGRIGVLPDQGLNFIKEVNDLSNIDLEGLSTHFAAADEEDKQYTFRQWEIFKKIIKKVKKKGIYFKVKHIANSAVVMDLPEEMYLDMVRPGIMIYGLYPSQEIKNKIELKPALSWKSKIIYLKEVKSGQGISYGVTFKTKKKSKIATIPLGYADGYSRLLSNKGKVLVKGQYTSIVGRICMDQFMIDVTDIKGVTVGDEAVLIGEQEEKTLSVDEMAKLRETINYEVICNISERVPIIYK